MNQNVRLAALKRAFPNTVPVMLGYLFVGVAFGLLLQQKGYGLIWAVRMSLFIYAGSMQFVAISFLAGGFSFVSITLLTLMINFRHLFYSLTMLNKFKDVQKKKKLYMIFALTDETYALLCSVHIPDGAERDDTLFFTSLLNQLYWIAGSAVGSLAGSLIPFNTKGIDFAMTALFVVILIEQLRKNKNFITAAVGALCAVIALLIFGAGAFILPAMLAICALLIVLRKPIEKGRADDGGCP